MNIKELTPEQHQTLHITLTTAIDKLEIEQKEILDDKFVENDERYYDNEEKIKHLRFLLKALENHNLLWLENEEDTKIYHDDLAFLNDFMPPGDDEE